MSMREIELKLILSDADIRALAASPAFAELTGGKFTTRLLRSVYFDTPNGALGLEKITLRIRDTGESHIQTVKVGGDLERGLSQTLEYENEITEEFPDLSLISDEKVARRVEAVIADETLKPLFETHINRTAALVDIAGEGTVELAIDIGDVRAGDKSAPLDEVELELKAGAPFVMLSVAEKLFANVAIMPSKLHKARRGFALIGLGEEEISLAPVFSKKTEITRGISGIEALRSVGKTAADQILQNWEFMLADPAPEGPHQLRVGLRRLRTALYMLNAKNLGPEFVALEEAARRLASVVGQLRDADVLLGDIYVPATDRFEEIPRCGVLHDALAAHITEKRKIVRESLLSVDWTQLKLSCLFFDFMIDRALTRARTGFKDPKILKHADKALAKAWRRVEKWGARIDDLTPEERHSMRKKLKSLRYVTEFFLPLYSAKKATPFLRKLQRLQDIFGYLNDVATSQQLLEIAANNEESGEEITLQASFIYNWHLDRAELAWQDARKRWRKLSRTERFWE